jgi:HTH-type transcriptional regulator/antitoxin HipB
MRQNARSEVLTMEQIARTPNQLAEILRRRRKQLNISQVTLAASNHLRQSTISTLENFRTDLRLGTLLELLAALDLELVVRPRTKGSASEIEDAF